ncbi:HIT-like domain-containing protein [Roridomyces roridus]|uniref:HIT-like domain-containing protein n=1 Tax=Roridomyces roridus TaxID=1738132 RepID=A0AAD7BWH9_9AGAR|nr:HIT-like domain-containing protein [Roridomyces roridus]
MSNLSVLRTYAQTSPSKLPPSVLFSSTSTSMTVFDAFPKAIFHFLILPRIQPPFTTSELSNLRTLLKGDKERAKEVITALNEDAKTLHKEIEEEMMARYGFKWGICTGFHAVPSMNHVHLHVISDDFCSDRLKNKKHYNSFHPKLGFFISLDEVLSWFEATPSYYSSMIKLDEKQYEPILKEDLVCWRCHKSMKNIPTLKAHLQEEWETQARREKAKLAK